MDDLKHIFFDRGIASGLAVQEIIDNQNTLKDAIEEHDPDIAYLHKMLGSSGSFSFAFEDKGLHTIYDTRTHQDMRIVNAHVTLGDNAPEPVTVRLLKNGKKDIAEPLTLKATEKRGKVQIFALHKHEIVSQYDSLLVDISTSRRVVVAGSVVSMKVI